LNCKPFGRLGPARSRRTGAAPPDPTVESRRHRSLRSIARLAPSIALSAALTLGLLTSSNPAYAADTGPVVLAADSIDAVVNNIRTWLVGILIAVATLFLTVGALRYLAANGDPGETEKGKLAMRSAAIGYGLALLAPLFVTIVGQWVK
jgi:hypothetical protein